MNFACIIPSRNPANLTPCLTALRKHEPNCPIMVVDDGLGDQGRDQALFCEPIKIIEGVKPFVFSRAMNMGMRAADDFFGEQLGQSLDGYLLCNDDALLESPKGFTLLSLEAARNKDIGIIGAVTNLTGQPLQRRRLSGEKIGLRYVPHIAFVAVYIPRRTIEVLNTFPFSHRESCTFATGVCNCDGNHGYLDEDFCEDYGVEDRSFCEAVTRAGLGVAVHDGTYVDHGSLTSSFRGHPEAPRSFQKNLAILMRKWGTLVTG